jgi:hypothetical protein
LTEAESWWEHKILPFRSFKMHMSEHAEYGWIWHLYAFVWSCLYTITPIDTIWYMYSKCL